eukprot:m51a1_g9892 putative guanine nucleotide-binding protein g subunit alpha-2 (332) ;mRNA; r:45803-47601
MGGTTSTQRPQGAPVEKREFKILLLGAGDSGKSTLVKQLHKREFKPIIFGHVLGSMNTLVQAVYDAAVAVAPENERAASRFLAIDAGDPPPALGAQIAADIKALWRDGAIQLAWTNARELQVPDSAAYYFNQIDRIAAPQYIPSDQDIVFTPSRTTGFSEVLFQSNQERFRIVDVGGQRSERRKWVECFQGVSAVIFCAPLSEFDMTLFEEPSQNRMEESLRLFRDICAASWFKSSLLVLFLNKRDLFINKLARARDNPALLSTGPLAGYKGPCEFEPAAAYIRDKYIAASGGRPLSVFYTCATDAGNIRTTFDSVIELVHRSSSVPRLYR